MNNIHFRLRAQGKSDPVIVLWVYDSRFKGRQFKYSTGEVINSDLWLRKRERAKVIPAKEKELTTLNDHLDKLNQSVIDFFATKHNSKTILWEDLRKYLDTLKVDEEKELALRQAEELEIEKQKLEKENDFFHTWERIINSTKTKDGLPIEKKGHISTHTARRSFATNAYLSRSMQVYEIMNCTGHKSESSFLKYLKLDGMDYAKLAAKSKFFNDRKLLKLRVVA